ncbi:MULTISPECIES: cyclic lactone autoinducer peptide [Clostridium]|nr:cyclic lactone autoinducer peptide [Clostridium cadaveris]MDU4953713.1 cyclic lactone autoinducer peptide [Clostridium sp.]NME65291.1 cyclic lactone autoinducer peptide [Clostridium cadaveris]NWK10646.1 cyclic lactone autoinducer peptide [Clostridium cadaveris]
MKKKVLMSLAAISTLVASLVATSACYWCFYQPEEPKSLREE